MHVKGQFESTILIGFQSLDCCTTSPCFRLGVVTGKNYVKPHFRNRPSANLRANIMDFRGF